VSRARRTDRPRKAAAENPPPRPAPGRRAHGSAAWAALCAATLIQIVAAPSASAHPSALAQAEQLEAEIRAHPGDPLPYLQRGRAFSEEGHAAEALADFEKAAELGDPNDVAFDLGVLHARMGRFDAACQDFDRWLARHPDHPPGLVHRARARRDAGKRAEALADYRAYFAVQPRPNPGDYVAAADLLVGPDGSGIPEALGLLDDGMQKLGLVPQLQGPAIALERRRDRLDLALVRLDALEPSLGTSPDWHVDRGELLSLAGRREEAVAELDAADARLDALRETAARRALRERIRALRANISRAPAREATRSDR